MSRHIREKRVSGKKQHGFTKCKLHLTNLIAFYYVMTGFEDDGSAVDVIYLHFGKLSTLSLAASLELN